MWLFYFLIVTLIIQFAYLLGPFRRLIQHQPAKTNVAHYPSVSVVICARNELENLKKLLPSLVQQDYPDFEIVVINDRSSDGSKEWLIDFEHKTQNTTLKFVHLTDKPKNWNGKKYALKTGIESASNTWLLLTDADCLPKSDNWIKEMGNHTFEDNNLILGTSFYSRKNGFLNAFIQYETFQTAIQYLSSAICGFPYMGVGRNMMYTKDLFLRSSQFSESFGVTGGDDDLFVSEVAKKDNTQICISQDSQTISNPPENFKSWFRQKIRHLGVSRHYNMKTKVILGVFHTSWLFYYILTITLLLNTNLFLITLMTFSLRTIAIFYIFGQLWKKLNGQTPYHLIPLMDFIYPFYIWFMGPIAMLFKKVKWR